MALTTRFTTNHYTEAQVREQVLLAQASPATDAFHRLWYHTPTTWAMVRYRGIPTLKCPLDLHMYHEIIMALRPTLIIETGTAFGGSALHFADCMALSGVQPHVITMDLEERPVPGFDIDWPTHGVHRVLGSSLDPSTVATVRAAAAATAGAVLVSLDSDHGKDHVLAELAVYAPLVTPGCYCVVEDTNIGGHPIPLGSDDGGPYAAVTAYLADHPELRRDVLCERFLLTMHPGGWLRRTEETAS